MQADQGGARTGDRETFWTNFARDKSLDWRYTPTAEDVTSYIPQDGPCQSLLAVCLDLGDDPPTAMAHVLAYHLTGHSGKDHKE